MAADEVFLRRLAERMVDLEEANHGICRVDYDRYEDFAQVLAYFDGVAARAGGDLAVYNEPKHVFAGMDLRLPHGFTWNGREEARRLAEAVARTSAFGIEGRLDSEEVLLSIGCGKIWLPVKGGRK